MKLKKIKGSQSRSNITQSKKPVVEEEKENRPKGSSHGRLPKKNKDKKNCLKIDLHGKRVPEAVDFVKGELYYGSRMKLKISWADDVSFDVNYDVIWGNDHVSIFDQGREVQLSMDNHSGSGFASKQRYGSGFFNMRIKLPNKDSSGVVTAFYLTSQGNAHDEVDFEFLGNKVGKPITLQTNVFAAGEGNREQRFVLWFDPIADFHSYKILWNRYQTVLYVDDIPIRVFKNVTGVAYPTQLMQIEASLWDGENWATDGGQTKTNWSSAPFAAHFQNFNVDACPNAFESCYELGYWWNQQSYWILDENEERELQRVRTDNMNYDYCADVKRFPNPPPECAYNI